MVPFSNRTRLLLPLKEIRPKTKKVFTVIDYISHFENTFAPEGSGRFPLSNSGRNISNTAFIPEDRFPVRKPCQPYAFVVPLKLVEAE